MRVTPAAGAAVQDHVALAEIELCGELIIAASAVHGERLSWELIDEVLKGVPAPTHPVPRPRVECRAGSG
ncbi:hypothetical protein [Streptomyces sp. NPDC006879]|uniref:hypothetical protein n=1 Tax=Streptomyces sp. NPDC006879 TaxID=3364767 RepID=UPI0036A1A8CC